MSQPPPPRRVVHFDVQPLELPTFAAWFTADWPSTFPDFVTGARLYIGRLAFERRVALADELATFLRRTKDQDAEGLRIEWHVLGAKSWQADLEIRATLRRFVEIALE